MVSRGPNLLLNWEWSDRFWPELWSGETEGEIPGIEVDQIPRLVMVRLSDMLVISFFVLVLGT